jgi:hypothetical protein
MNFKKLFIIVFVCVFSSAELSCIRELGVTFPSINIKKRKKKLGPSYDFSSELFNYRQKNGHWPNSELDFTAYNAKVVRDIQNQGFESWSLGQFSQDTLYVYWIHAPIVDGAHVGIVPIPDKKIYLISRYTFENRNVITKTIKRKKFTRLTGR